MPQLFQQLRLGLAEAGARAGHRGVPRQVRQPKQRTFYDWSRSDVDRTPGGLAIRTKTTLEGGIAVRGNSTVRDEALARIGFEAMGLA